MATNLTQSVGGDLPEDTEDLLLSDSVLCLDEYLAMHAAVGYRTRYEILYQLVDTGDMGPTELEAAMDIDDSILHYYLNKLVDVGLVEKCQRTAHGRDGLYTCYRATVRRSDAYRRHRRTHPWRTGVRTNVRQHE